MAWDFIVKSRPLLPESLGRCSSSGESGANRSWGSRRPDLRTLFCCAHTSVYTLRVKVPGNPHSWYKRRGQ
jgi:hypothetical protein